MLSKYYPVLATVLAVCQAASLERNIPVEVRYERFKHDITPTNQIKDDSNDLSLQELDLHKDTAYTSNNSKLNYNKNLEAKIQLSPAELFQAYKHVPIKEPIQKDEPDNVETSEITYSTVPIDVIQEVENIIETNLRSLSKSFTSESSGKILSEFEEDSKRLIEETKSKISTRQNPGNQQNFFQTFQNAWQNLTSNFITGLNGVTQSNQNTTSNDEADQQQGIVAGIVGGVQEIFSSVSSFINRTQTQSASSGGNGTVQADSGNEQSGIVGNIINTFQQAGSDVQNFLSGIGNRTQNPVAAVNSTVLGDSGTQPANNNGILGDVASGIGNLAQQVQSGVQSIFNANRTQTLQGNSTVLGDSGNQPGGSNVIIDNLTHLGSNIQQGIQQGVQQVQQAFGGSQTKPPEGSEDENTSSQGPNIPIIGGIIEQISNIFSPQSSSPTQSAQEASSTNNKKPSEDTSNELTTVSTNSGSDTTITKT